MNTMKKLASLSLACVLSSGLSVAHAVDGFGIQAGHGDDSTDLLRVNAKWNWDRKWPVGDGWHLTGYWEAALGRWEGKGVGAKTLAEAAVTPVFRLSRADRKSGPYVEAGIGAHLTSAQRINRHREFGGHFNFGTHVGFGVLFGDDGRYDLGYRFQHVSNAGISSPNDGINFHQVSLRYNY